VEARQLRTARHRTGRRSQHVAQSQGYPIPSPTRSQGGPSAPRSNSRIDRHESSHRPCRRVVGAGRLPATRTLLTSVSDPPPRLPPPPITKPLVKTRRPRNHRVSHPYPATVRLGDKPDSNIRQGDGGRGQRSSPPVRTPSVRPHPVGSRAGRDEPGGLGPREPNAPPIPAVCTRTWVVQRIRPELARPHEATSGAECPDRRGRRHGDPASRPTGACVLASRLRSNPRPRRSVLVCPRCQCDFSGNT